MFSKIKVLSNYAELMMAVGVVFILGVMILPIPPLFMDLLITGSLAISIIILLTSIYTKKPLEFSTFPSILLISTLFRLSLNVASTRNILLNAGDQGTGASGDIIKAFGDFVVAGNYIVGIIVFLILVIINFMVITKGAGRVAEVAARFTLDAMPGKQMAIDADLNAGLIDDTEAKRRRAEVAEEADFYGSMDGASKFVRGDAIAGILITLINILGGIVVGVVEYNMSVGDAAHTFTLLTVGDGLVSQIPALIISTAAGIITTRNTNDISIGQQIGDQIKLNPKAIYLSGGVLGIFGLVPGLPTLPFSVLALSCFGLAYKIEKSVEDQKSEAIKADSQEKTEAPETLEDLLSLELIELEVGYGIVNLVDAEQNGDLLERITHIRKQFALDWGVIIPSVKIKDNLEINPAEYVLKIKGIDIARGELMSDHFLAMDSGTVIEKIDGIETVEPVFGLPAVWITEDQKDDAQYSGYTVVDLSTVMATHLTELLKANLHELFGRQELVRVLDTFKVDYPKVVSDLIPDILNLGQVLKVLQNLLRENVSVRDLRTILETLAEHGSSIKDTELLTEMVRQSLYRTITESVKNESGEVPIFTLDKTIEERVANSIVQTESGNQLSLDPQTTQTILASLNEKIEEATNIGERMIILCSPVIRGHFKRLTEKFIPSLIIVSHNEISPEANIKSLGTVRL